MIKRMWRNESGQMTVELCMFLPVAIVVALIAVNATLFFGDCARFDRVGKNAVRVHATSPTYGQDKAQTQSIIESELQSSFEASNEFCEVSVSSNAFGFDTYEMTLHFRPTLFGMGLRDEFFGVSVPPLKHTTSLTIAPYKPGMLF